MKASEIKAVLTARPNAIFRIGSHKNGGCVRIVEVNEVPYRTRGQNRTSTTYTVDVLNLRVGSYRPDEVLNGEDVLTGWDNPPSYDIRRGYGAWSPKDIHSVVEDELTLEEYGARWLVDALSKHEENKRDSNAYNQLVIDVVELTGINQYTISRTDREVLVALRNALDGHVSA